MLAPTRYGKDMRKPTEFEKKVYRATMEIPLGETRSYRWVAERIGHPKAVRAVGSALNRNPFAPFVPCHRVVRSDGSIGGFAEGTERKRQLLDEEKKICEILK
jgi:methylated-DNA-[protein]-cysteine S-methyltransferase